MKVANSVVWMFWCIMEREKKAMGDPGGWMLLLDDGCKGQREAARGASHATRRRAAAARRPAAAAAACTARQEAAGSARSS
jgi:hypothetical protein